MKTHKHAVLLACVIILVALFIPKGKIMKSSNNYVRIISQNRIQHSSGFMAPGSCASQPIQLSFSGPELAEILNRSKPATILLYDIRLEVREGKLFGSAVSAYPFLPGNISGSAILQDNTFIIDEMNIGAIPIPEALTVRFNTNGNQILKGLLKDNGFDLSSVNIIGDRLNVYALVCPGLIQQNPDGTITIDKSAVN